MKEQKFDIYGEIDTEQDGDCPVPAGSRSGMLEQDLPKDKSLCCPAPEKEGRRSGESESDYQARRKPRWPGYDKNVPYDRKESDK